MNAKRLLLTAGSLASLTLSLGFSGCAEERPPINRVQPYALEKSWFVGEDLLDPKDDPEFYHQATLIDVGYGAAQDGLFTSTYAQPMARLKWEVTEGLLLGRIAYERIEGTDGKGVGGPVNDGIIAVAFKIEKHFDIVNAYNPTTGEKQNIVEENSSDRPWYERKYFRVDWSQNLSTENYDFDTLSMVGIFGGVTYTPMRYDVTDPFHPDAPVFEMDKGAEAYFDVTNKAFAAPQQIDLSRFGWGIDKFPACFLEPDFLNGSGPSGMCSPVELTIRHSFRRVVDTDYEPADWDGYRFSAFGAFNEERYGYARNYGMSDDLWHRFISRYNIWERSHYYQDPVNMTGHVACFTPETTPYGADPHRDENGNGTEDECEAVGAGSRCDTFKQRCTLPYVQRTAKPVVWHYSKGSDPEYFDSTREAAHMWDVGLRMAVQSARYAECRRVGGGKDECAAQHPTHFGQQDENDDTERLTWEVTRCRLGEAYVGQDCNQVAEAVGQRRGYSRPVIEIAKMDPMLVLCHSPVQANDPAECGDQRLPAGVTVEDCEHAWQDRDSDLFAQCQAARSARIGDLRYNLLNVIPFPQTPSPWGIMVDANDPLTGEAISGSSNVWSFVNDLWSQKTVDMLRYVAGELTDEQVTEGTHIRNWARAAEAASSGGMTPKYTAAQAQAAATEFALEPAKLDGAAMAAAAEAYQQIDPSTLQLPADVINKARNLKRELSQVRASLDATSVNRPIYAQRAQAARGSVVEAQLMTPMVQEMMGVKGMGMSDSVLNNASLLRGANPSFTRDLYNLRENALAKRGACIMQEAPAPMSITGLADVLQEKFGRFNPDDDPATQEARAERMRKYMAQRAQVSVMAHEMGHSMGLRHNFVSSSDSFNYRPQYWQLRTKNGAVTETCRELSADGEGCIGPRYFDPMTKGERDNLLWMFMHSSTMDYAGEPTQDFLGLGAYDYAAARMFYGEAVAVYEDESYAVGSNRGQGVLAKTDNFGGIIGYTWEIGGVDDNLHYSELQKHYDLIQDCQAVDPNDFKPDSWNTELNGEWHPVLDGMIVEVDGQYTRCKQQRVDYVPYTSLRMPTEGELGSTFFRGGRNIDAQGRMRVPYGFASDNWADLGNLSVYRHDNGADPYELFDFFIANQEIYHIWDNYRRNRQTFSVRQAAGRTLGRYNEKMRDGAKGLGLMKNIYEDFSLSLGYNFDQFWPVIAPLFFKDNILASGLAFDHFARQIQRPEHGEHFTEAGDPVLRSARDYVGDPGAIRVVIPNGATGLVETVGIGGRPVENELADDKGDYDSYYTLNAGSYYEKMYAGMLFTESVDNFISSSRTDFVDPRYRAVSLADLFPEGFRRMLANNLTGDDFIKGPRLRAGFGGLPRVDAEGYPTDPIGWTTWWGSTPRVCFPGVNSHVCGMLGAEDDPVYGSMDPGAMVPVDPQVGWEQQKFLIAMTLLYLPENQKTYWLEQLRIYELGVENDPVFANRIELHHPSGRVFVAKTCGKEEIFGKRVHRCIGARVLEYANELLALAYEVTPGPDLDNDGEPEWFVPVIGDNGMPIVRWDPTVSAIGSSGNLRPNGEPGCNAQSNEKCTCAANRSCVALDNYVSVPVFMREAFSSFGYGLPSARGIY